MNLLHVSSKIVNSCWFFMFHFFSITWQVSVSQDLLPGNMILTEVILENKIQINILYNIS